MLSVFSLLTGSSYTSDFCLCYLSLILQMVMCRQGNQSPCFPSLTRTYIRSSRLVLRQTLRVHYVYITCSDDCTCY